MSQTRERDPQKIIERNNYIKEIFARDVQQRRGLSFVTPPLSAPKAQKLFKEKYGVALNSQKMYDLRDEVFKAEGLDGHGMPAGTPVKRGPGRPKGSVNKPKARVQKAAPMTAANRTETDVTAHVAVLPIADEAQGIWLKEVIGELVKRGMAPKTLQVDNIHSCYATVSNFQ